jgi:hypothetical protein
MSNHPNAMLILALTPDDLARKTYRAILKEAGIDPEEELKIDDQTYHHGVMESDYEEDFQLELPEGTIYIFDLVTYDYGEKIEWSKLEAQKLALEEWGRGICERHHCQFEIFIGANYW